jgi:threonine dehydrogenase-like Zn-dependent dehydrogenase
VLVVGGAGDVAPTPWLRRRAGSGRSITSTPTRRLAVADRLGATAVDRTLDGRSLGRYPITVDHSGETAGLQSAIRSTEPEGTCTATAIYFSPETPLPLLDMYTRGITFRTGRVNARAVIPDVLAAVAAGRLRPELVTAAIVTWDEADTALAQLDAKTVVTRREA